MANARVVKGTRSVQKIVEVPEETIVLELSKEEAEALVGLFGNVGGDPYDSPRKHIDSIDRALVPKIAPSYDEQEKLWAKFDGIVMAEKQR